MFAREDKYSSNHVISSYSLGASFDNNIFQSPFDKYLTLRLDQNTLRFTQSISKPGQYSVVHKRLSFEPGDVHVYLQDKLGQGFDGSVDAQMRDQRVSSG